MSEKIGLDAVFGTSSFSAGMKTYLSGLRDSSQQTVTTGQTLGGVLKGLGSTAGLVFAGMAVAVAGAATAFVAGAAQVIFGTAGMAHDLGVLEAKTGMSAEQLQEMGYVAKLLGVDLDSIATAQARLSKAMYAADKPTTEQYQAFSKLGVKIRDTKGELRDANTVMLEAFDALSRMKNPTEADALAMTIFGRGAMELAPFIKAGKKGIQELTIQARDMGYVMSNEDVAAFDAFDEEVDGLKMGLGTLAKKGFRPLLPIFKAAANGLFRFLVNPKFQSAVNSVTGYIGKIAEMVAGKIAPAFDSFSEKFGAAWTKIANDPNVQKFVTFWKLRIANLIDNFSLENVIKAFTDFGKLVKNSLGEKATVDYWAEQLAGWVDGVDWSKYGAQLGGAGVKIFNAIVGGLAGVDKLGEGGLGTLGESIATAFGNLVVGALTLDQNATFQANVADVWGKNIALINSTIAEVGWEPVAQELLKQIWTALTTGNYENPGVAAGEATRNWVKTKIIDPLINAFTAEWTERWNWLWQHSLLDIVLAEFQAGAEFWKSVGGALVTAITGGFEGGWPVFKAKVLVMLGNLLLTMGQELGPFGGLLTAAGNALINANQGLANSTYSPVAVPGQTGGGTTGNGGTEAIEAVTININNPVAEKSSVSVNQTLKKLNYLGVI